MLLFMQPHTDRPLEDFMNHYLGVEPGEEALAEYLDKEGNNLIFPGGTDSMDIEEVV